MQCVKCGSDTHVLQTRGVRRRRECLVCGERFTTIETVFAGSLSGDSEPAERKPKVEKAPPSISRSKEKQVARKKARDEIERRSWEKETDYYAEDNNFLPDRW